MSGRPRGFASWTPQRRTLDLLGSVDAVLAEYADYLPLTLRQVFYRLVGAHGYEKTESAYDRLGETLNRARRSGLVAFQAIRDDGLTELVPAAFSGKPDFWKAVSYTAETYRLERLARQAVALELWVEAAGMAPQLASAVEEYGVPAYSSGGFDSLTVKYEAAGRIAARTRPTIVLHVGDFDPSGLALFESAQEDVSAFVDGLEGVPPKFVRVAVTPAQIAAYGLPSAPPKKADKRSVWRDGDETVQAEALPPNVLAAEVRQAVETRLDLDELARLLAEEDRQREELLAALAQGSSGS